MAIELDGLVRRPFITNEAVEQRLWDADLSLQELRNEADARYRPGLTATRDLVTVVRRASALPDVAARHLSDVSLERLEAVLRGQPTRLKSLAFFAAAQAHYARRSEHRPELDPICLLPTNVTDEVDGARRVQQTTLPRSAYEGLGIDPGVVDLLARIASLGGPIDAESFPPIATVEQVSDFDTALLPEEREELADALAGAWRLMEVPASAEVYGLSPELDAPCVVRAEIQSPEGEHVLKDEVSVDNLPTDLQRLAQKASWLARLERGEPVSRADRTPAVVCLEDIDRAQASGRFGEPPVRRALLGAVRSEVASFAAGSCDLVARAQLLPPGEQPPACLLSADGGRIAMDLVTTWSYQSEHGRWCHQDFFGRRDRVLRFTLPEGHRAVLVPADTGQQSDDSIVADAGEDVVVPEGTYQVVVFADVAPVVRGVVEVPSLLTELTNLSELMGYELSFVDGPAAVVVQEETDGFIHTTLERPAPHDADAPNNHRAQLAQHSVVDPGRHRATVGDASVDVDVFPSGLVRAVFEGDDGRRRAHPILGGDAVVDRFPHSPMGDVLFRLGEGSIVFYDNLSAARTHYLPGAQRPGEPDADDGPVEAEVGPLARPYPPGTLGRGYERIEREINHVLQLGHGNGIRADFGNFGINCNNVGIFVYEHPNASIQAVLSDVPSRAISGAQSRSHVPVGDNGHHPEFVAQRLDGGVLRFRVDVSGYEIGQSLGTLSQLIEAGRVEVLEAPRWRSA